MIIPLPVVMNPEDVAVTGVDERLRRHGKQIFHGRMVLVRSLMTVVPNVIYLMSKPREKGQRFTDIDMFEWQ
jgi:hypothetical protein